MHTSSWCGNSSEKVDQDVDGRIILKLIFKEMRSGSMNWTDVAQDRDSWRVLLNALRNLGVPLNAGNFLKCGGLLDTHEGLCSIRSVI